MPSASSQPVTLRDIARRCRLTTATVSMALRDHPRISEATRQRVKRAAGKLGYEPLLTASARRLVRPRQAAAAANRVLGLLAPPDALRTRYFHRMIQPIWDRCASHGYGLLSVAPVIEPGADRAQWRKRLAPLLRGEIDGLIGIAAQNLLPRLNEFRRHAGLRDLPAVVLGSEAPGYVSIVGDSQPGINQMIERLLALGHRRMVHLAYRPTLTPPALPQGGRFEQIQRALSRAGVDPAAALLAYATPADWMNPHVGRSALSGSADPTALESLAGYLRDHADVTALLCDNDAIAMHAWVALSRAQWSVPGRCSLVGFDDTDAIPDARGRNGLSSIRVPLEELGAAAARSVLDQIGRSTPMRPHVIRLATVYIERASVGPAGR